MSSLIEGHFLHQGKTTIPIISIEEKERGVKLWSSQNYTT